MPNHIRELFPILKEWTYLDSAATSLRHPEVVEEEMRFYREFNANIHRGAHSLSIKATEAYEEARKKIAKHINAKEEEIIFVKNTTEGLNLLALMLKEKFHSASASYFEHHSNLLPWRKYFKFQYLELNIDGEPEKVPKTDVLAVFHASNVLGSVSNLKAVREEHESIMVVDGAQGFPHFKIDVKKLGIDAYAASGHKALGPTGIGFLYIREDLLEELEPPLVGGGAVKAVGSSEFINDVSFSKIPERFEPGTPPIAQAIAFGKAIEILDKWKEEFHEEEKKLTKKLIDSMPEGFEVVGPKDVEKRTPLVSFFSEKLHAHDVAEFLNSKKIAVRSGYHCAEPLHKKLGIPPTVRASLYFYNNEEDVEKFLTALEELSKMLERF